MLPEDIYLTFSCTLSHTHMYLTFSCTLSHTHMHLTFNCTLSHTQCTLAQDVDADSNPRQPVAISRPKPKVGFGQSFRKLATPPPVATEYFNSVWGRLRHAFKQKFLNRRRAALEIEDDGEELSSHWSLMIRTSLLFCLALLDLVFAFVQLLWGVDDLFCYHSTNDDSNTSPRTQVRYQHIVTLLCFTEAGNAQCYVLRRGMHSAMY